MSLVVAVDQTHDDGAWRFTRPKWKVRYKDQKSRVSIVSKPE